MIEYRYIQVLNKLGFIFGVRRPHKALGKALW